MTLVVLLVGAAALTLALAFDLGGRDIARQVSAGRYVAAAFQVGQHITVADLTGEIIGLESAATLLRTDDGRTLRIPHHLLIDAIVGIDSPWTPA